MDPITMRLYRESVSPKTNLPIGDDAVPYIGSRLISVADGSGGQSNAKQTDINPELLDRGTAFEAAVQGILDPAAPEWEQLRIQFEENFFTETFDLARDYAAAGGRKSCYFGSRLANLFLREALEKRFPGETLDRFFDELNAASAEERSRQAADIGEELAKQLFDRMQQAETNCGLKRSSSSKQTLMSTTYSGILFLEREDCVDVLSIQAGDSQSYAMVREQTSSGQELVLKLLQAPHENSNGDMNNFINSERPFRLTCAYQRFRKPCALLCASDGCFDAFSSPALFERFLMTEIRAGLKNEDMSAAAENMERFLAARTSDDTSSMAFIAFSFDRDIRLDMQAREENLTSRMEMDNAEMYSRQDPPESRLKYVTTKRNETLKKHAAEFWEKSAWVREQYMPADSGEDENQQQEDKQQEIIRLRGRLAALVREQWQTGGFSGTSVQASNQYSQISSLEMEIFRAVPAVERARDSLAGMVSSISLRDAAKEPGAYFSDRQQDLRQALDRLIDEGKKWEDLNRRKAECEGKYHQLAGQPEPADELLIHLYCLMMAGDIPRPDPDMPEENRKQYAEEALAVLNREYAGVEASAEEIEDLMDELAVLESRRPRDPGDLYRIIGEIYRLRKAVSAAGPARRNSAAADAARRAFLDRPHAVVLACWEEHRDTLDPADVQALEEEVAPFEQKVGKLQEIVDRKQRMAEEYNLVYKSMLPGEAPVCP